MRLINPDQTWLHKRAYRKGGGKGDDGGGTSIDPRIVEMAQKGTFQPFSIRTSAGEGFGRKGEFGANSSSPFANLQQGALSGANQLIGGIASAANQPARQFDFNFNVDQRTADNFATLQATLDPAFAQQRAQLQSDLFGGGRLGLRLASEGVGAGAGGMVQPDAFGLARAQSQTLTDAYSQARQQALAEQNQLFTNQLQQFGANVGTEQQRFQNLLGGTQGLFGIGQGISAQELELLQAGLLAEQIRGQSYTDAAAALAAGQVQDQGDGGKGLLGSAIGAAGQVGAAAVTASDKRLKDNIVQVGQLTNGIKLYTWKWNDLAKKLKLDGTSPFGVIAQEVLEIMPSAVKKDPVDGYYRVNYNEVYNG